MKTPMDVFGDRIKPYPSQPYIPKAFGTKSHKATAQTKTCQLERSGNREYLLKQKQHEQRVWLPQRTLVNRNSLLQKGKYTAYNRVDGREPYVAFPKKGKATFLGKATQCLSKKK